MKLTIESESAVFRCEVKSYPTLRGSTHALSLPSGASGYRRVNDILLLDYEFNRFISAITGDDFEVCREILGRCKDIYDMTSFRPGWDGEPVDAQLKRLIG